MRTGRRTPPLLIAALGALIAVSASAQQPSDAHRQTTPPTGARFEVLQSQLAARWTFRLDRFTGRIAQLVKTKEDENTWEEMEVIGLPQIQAPNRARFQLFTSGLAARYTFLIDTDTGKTWVLVSVKRTRSDGTEYELSGWRPFPD